MNQKILNFLQVELRRPVQQARFIGKGLFSEAYTFEMEDQAYIFRLNADDRDFKKDVYAYQHWYSPYLPIPEIIKMGQFDKTHFFAISRQCPGVTFNQLTLLQKKEVFPHLLQTLDYIHQVQFSDHVGKGILDTQGQGIFSSWKESILSLKNPKIPYDWDYLIHQTFLDKSLFDHCQTQMQALLQFCPEEKYLVHGDFGFDNIIIDQGKVTGVLDWAESRIGDPLYDTAWLCFWAEDELDVLHSLNASQKNIPQRLLCYVLHIGLNGMLIAAHLKDKTQYKDVVNRIQKWETRLKQLAE